MIDTMDVLKKYAEDREKVVCEIKTALSGKPEKLYQAGRHLSLAGGKLIRPMLCMLSCEACGGRREDAVKTAAAIELTHTFTLIHDDIMDHDDLRRGAPAVHKLYGEATAILAGDLLFSKAFEICDPKVTHILAHASSEICEGQEMDMSFEETFDVTLDLYMEMIRKKTAVLLEAATKSGAVLGGGSQKEIEALASFGTGIGLAFQIHDDVLGLTADEKTLGKPVGSDIEENKKNIIVITALDELVGRDAENFRRIMSRKEKSKKDVADAIDILKSAGIIDACRKKSDRCVEDAKKSLSILKDGPAKEALLAIADYVVERKL